MRDGGKGAHAEVPTLATPPVVSVLFVVYASLIFYTMHCSFISSEAYSSPSIVIGCFLFSFF